jgi:hypothetical protein
MVIRWPSWYATVLRLIWEAVGAGDVSYKFQLHESSLCNIFISLSFRYFLCACVDHRLDGDVVAMGIHGVGCMWPVYCWCSSFQFASIQRWALILKTFSVVVSKESLQKHIWVVTMWIAVRHFSPQLSFCEAYSLLLLVSLWFELRAMWNHVEVLSKLFVQRDFVFSQQ